MTLSEKIKQLRKENNWSQDKLGKKIGLDARQICRYEKNVTKPSTETLEKLANVFNVPLSVLLTENETDALKSFGIRDQELLKYFQAIDKMNEEERKAIKFVLKPVIMTSKMKDIFSE